MPSFMDDDIAAAAKKVTLLGGGPADRNAFDRAVSIAPRLVAADGGANHVLARGHPLARIIGDLDSINYREFWRQSGVELTHLGEQETTDFEKCLYSEEAQLYIGIGFLGERIDHSLACLRTLAAYPDKRVILVGESDITFLCPQRFEIEMAEGARVSFFPMDRVVAGPSEGLAWPLDGLAFAPSGRIGTSNRALGGLVRVEFDRPAMLTILPLDFLEPVAAALCAMPAAPAR